MLKLVVYFAFIFVRSGTSKATDVPILGSRIAGGTDADIVDYPYQVSFQYLGEHLCGGAIIAVNWVVTAAHCVPNVPKEYLNVRVGSADFGNGGYLIMLSKIISHPKYYCCLYHYDVALLRLSSPINFTTSIQSIYLPSTTRGASVGETATITGWGALVEGGNQSSLLQQVQVPVLRQADCEAAYESFTIDSTMFCAGYIGIGGKDACQGDSGGPLVVNGVLYGIVSWGMGCAGPEHPGVYTNVSFFRQWILDTISK